MKNYIKAGGSSKIGNYIKAVASGPALDPDAQAFLTAASITDPTITSAINTLVLDMKTANIWSKMKAIYPFVGGTASTHKYNLKDPQDTNAAFRLNFVGGWTHSITGALPNGTNAYADTFLIPNTNLSLNSNHGSFYSRTNQSSAALTVEFGCSITLNEFPVFLMVLRSNTSNFIFQTPDLVNRNVVSNTDSRGFYIGTRTANNAIESYKNNTSINTNTGTHSQTQLPTNKLYLSAYNYFGGTVHYSAKECAFASFGDGLTDTEAANFYTAVQAFNTTLNRQVI